MFKNAPTPQEFKEGDDAVIVCDVVSSLPPTIIWKHKGRDVILKKDGKGLVLVHSPSHTGCWWSRGAGGAVCAPPVGLNWVIPGAVVCQWQGSRVPTEMAIRLGHWKRNTDPRSAIRQKS